VYGLAYLVLELKRPKIVEEEVTDKKDAKKKAADKDAKKDPKKKQGGAGKKDEEEEMPKVIPTIKITADLIEEESIEEFLKLVRTLQMRTPKLLLLLVTLESAEMLGDDPKELSVKFLEEILNKALETTIFWEKDWEISDWADKMENEYYPEEGIVLFENLALKPVELGFETLTVTEPTQAISSSETSSVQKQKRFKCMYQDIKDFAEVLSQYGNVVFY
jgi:hypothetical protein